MIPDRNKFARLFYGFTLIFFFLRWKNHVLLSQLCAPQLTYLSTDLTYIAFAFSGLGKFLVQHYWAALTFDLCLIGSALFSFFYTRQNVSSIVFTILLGIYVVVGYSFLCFHKHNLTGFWFCSLLFIVKDLKGFSISFELIRLYCLYAYASAGFWKFFRGVWDLPGHFSIVLKNDALAYTVQHSTGFLSAASSWLIAHPGLLDKLMLLSCFAQISFVIGFFTKKLDWFFFIYAISFHLLAFLFLRASFLEFGLILITLMPLPLFYKKVQPE